MSFKKRTIWSENRLSMKAVNTYLKKRHLVAFDLDGTLLTKNTSLAFCRFLYQKKELSFPHLLFCLFNYSLYLVGRISLEKLYHKSFQKLFLGKSIEKLLSYVPQFVDQLLAKDLYEPTMDRLWKALEQANEVCLLSSSPRFLVEAIAKRWRILSFEGSTYDVDASGCLSAVDSIFTGEKKAFFLKQRMVQEKIDHSEAFSDSIDDLPLLTSASVAFAVRPDKRLKKHALYHGWKIL